MKSKKIAIITGASSGLGRELTKLAAKQGKYSEIWIVARRMERLKKLQKNLERNFAVKVCPFSYDLSKQESIQEFQGLLEKEKPNVRLLINAAGFGKIGTSEEISLEDTIGMVQVNCIAPIAMTKIVLPFMGKGAHIMQICSTAAFQPFPFLNVYAASKAFLYRYSRALNKELSPKKITVTAVCPYWVKDTEFIPTARGENYAIRHFPLATRQKKVAKRAMKDTMLGLSVSTPGFVCTMHRMLVKVFSAEFCMKVWDIVRKM